MTTRFALLPVIAIAVAACSSDPTTTTGPTPPSAPQFTTNFGNAPQGAHFAQGSSQPVCTISGLTISCTGTQINGVGNTNANLSLSVTYTATVRCRNHGGKIVDVKSQVENAGAADVALAPKNGNLQVPAIDIGSSEAPSQQDFLDQATCPNTNWTKELLAGTPTISSFSYTVTFVGFAAPVITLP